MRRLWGRVLGWAEGGCAELPGCGSHGHEWGARAGGSRVLADMRAAAMHVIFSAVASVQLAGLCEGIGLGSSSMWIRIRVDSEQDCAAANNPMPAEL